MSEVRPTDIYCSNSTDKSKQLFFIYHPFHIFFFRTICFLINQIQKEVQKLRFKGQTGQIANSYQVITAFISLLKSSYYFSNVRTCTLIYRMILYWQRFAQPVHPAGDKTMPQGRRRFPHKQVGTELTQDQPIRLFGPMSERRVRLMGM